MSETTKTSSNTKTIVHTAVREKPRSNDLAARARKLADEAIGIDSHIDTVQRILVMGEDLSKRRDVGHVDIPRLHAGGTHAPFFALWVPVYFPGAEAVRRTLDLRDAMQTLFDAHKDLIEMATTAADIERIVKERKIAAFLAVEGGHTIDDDLRVLRMYYQLGIRSMTLTHSRNNNWADSATDKPAHNGLTDFGKQVVREMNRLGMMVDVSHVADKTFYDVLAVSKAPVIASHSSCRALCSAPRNMTDDMIKALAAKGGVIQINYHIGFLSQQFQDASKAHPELGKEIEAESKKRCSENEACQLIEADKITREMVAQGKLPRVDWTEIIKHIDHAVKLAGVDHVGLGSDFDGADMPYGMEDVSDIPQITNALLAKGYSPADVRKILGGNTLRLMQDVEAAAQK